jgi:hypothetical protein
LNRRSNFSRHRWWPRSTTCWPSANEAGPHHCHSRWLTAVRDRWGGANTTRRRIPSSSRAAGAEWSGRRVCSGRRALRRAAPRGRAVPEGTCRRSGRGPGSGCGGRGASGGAVPDPPSAHPGHARRAGRPAPARLGLGGRRVGPVVVAPPAAAGAGWHHHQALSLVANWFLNREVPTWPRHRGSQPGTRWLRQGLTANRHCAHRCGSPVWSPDETESSGSGQGCYSSGLKWNGGGFGGERFAKTRRMGTRLTSFPKNARGLRVALLLPATYICCERPDR